jgi:hypothetical protein
MPGNRAFTAVSNSAADRAGNDFRLWANMNPRPPTGDLAREERERLLRAIITIDEYRRMHARPMAAVTMGIRSMVRTTRRQDDIRPGQRFKRFDRILNKLVRFPRMRLSQMEDIGGRAHSPPRTSA